VGAGIEEPSLPKGRNIYLLLKEKRYQVERRTGVRAPIRNQGKVATEATRAAVQKRREARALKKPSQENWGAGQEGEGEGRPREGGINKEDGKKPPN